MSIVQRPTIILHLILMLVACSSRLNAQQGLLPMFDNDQHPNGLNVFYFANNFTIVVNRFLSQPPPPPSPPTTTTPNPAVTVNSTATAQPPPTSPITPPPPPVTTGDIRLWVGGIREMVNDTTTEVSPAHAVPDVGTVTGMTTDKFCRTGVFNIPMNNATVSIKVCPDNGLNDTFFNNGSVPESTHSYEGQMQIAELKISNWVWATDGQYLELTLGLGVRDGRKVTAGTLVNGQPLRLDLGVADSYALLSTKVSDGNVGAWANFRSMPTGYPKLTQTNPAGPMYNVTLMLPRTATNVVLYRPIIIEPGYTDASKTPSPTVGTASRAFSAMSTLFCAVLALCMTMIARFN